MAERYSGLMNSLIRKLLAYLKQRGPHPYIENLSWWWERICRDVSHGSKKLGLKQFTQMPVFIEEGFVPGFFFPAATSYSTLCLPKMSMSVV